MEHKKEYVQECFTEIADHYDEMNNLMTWGMLKGWQRLVMKKTGLKAGDRALDVCCGTGEMAFQQRKIVGPRGSVVGLDFTQQMLDVANAKLAKTNIRNMTFVRGDAMDLPFGDNTFQAATNGFALRNVLDIPKTIQEMARVVAPGGRIVCIDVSRPKFFLFRWFFNLYYFKLVPLIGHRVDKNKRINQQIPAYTWLAESLKTLPSQDKIKEMFLEAGLTDVGYRGVGFGAATIYWGTK